MTHTAAVAPGAPRAPGVPGPIRALLAGMAQSLLMGGSPAEFGMGVNIIADEVIALAYAELPPEVADRVTAPADEAGACSLCGGDPAADMPAVRQPEPVRVSRGYEYCPSCGSGIPEAVMA